MIWVILGFIIFFAYTIEAITGFGSIVIALALASLLMPMDTALPILVALNICMTGYITSRQFRFIDKDLLVKLILPGMIIGTAIGYFFRESVDEIILKQLFGVLIVWFSARELWLYFSKHGVKTKPWWLTQVITYMAGVTHGLFASGGPLLVFALAGTSLAKAQFRATLIFVWFLLNFSLTIAFLVDGKLMPVLPKLVFYLPVIVLAIFIGGYVHDKVKEEHFKLATYILLNITGLILVISPIINQLRGGL